MFDARLERSPFSRLGSSHPSFLNIVASLVRRLAINLIIFRTCY